MLFTGPPLTTFERIALPACSVLMLAAVGTLVVGMQTKRPALLKIGGVLVAAVVVIALLLRPRRDTFEEAAVPAEAVVQPSSDAAQLGTVVVTPIYKPKGGCSSVCFSKDGKYLFVGGQMLTVYKVTGGVLTVVTRRSFQDKRVTLNGLALSNNGKMLAGAANSRVVLFDVAKLVAGRSALMASKGSWPLPKSQRYGWRTSNFLKAGTVMSVAFTSDDSMLLVTDYDSSNPFAVTVPKLKIAFMTPPLNTGIVTMSAMHPFDADKVLVGMTALTKDELGDKGSEQCVGGKVTEMNLSEWTKDAPTRSYYETRFGGCYASDVAGINDTLVIAFPIEDTVRAYTPFTANATAEINLGYSPVALKATSSGLLVASRPPGMEGSPTGGRLDILNPATLERTVVPFMTGADATGLAVSGDLVAVAGGDTLALISLSGAVAYQVYDEPEFRSSTSSDGVVQYQGAEPSTSPPPPPPLTSPPPPTSAVPTAAVSRSAAATKAVKAATTKATTTKKM